MQADADSQAQGRFVTGSTLRHVVVMATTGAVGLMAIFAVDLVSLLYISWLDDKSITAGVGLATILLFAVTAVNVGLMIATGALVSRALGARDRAGARRLATSTIVLSVAAASLSTLAVYPFVPALMALLGAEGRAHAVGVDFVNWVLWAKIPMAAGMSATGVLRAVGDARRAMYVTLWGAILIAILDPILIFGMGLGYRGAAIGLAASHIAFPVIAFLALARVHDLLARPTFRDLRAHAGPMLWIAGPAILTTVASPVASGFAASVIARFGTEAIAGNAILDRLVPFAFGGLFALSGAVGPILGQNWGAGRFERMRAILRDSMLVAFVYVLVTWGVLVVFRHEIVALFGVSGEAADLVVFFCLISGPVWFCQGLLFVANAAFNNLGRPLVSTAFNWGRATIGTLPFALAGAALAGPQGVIAAIGIGAIAFGLGGIATAFWTIGALERRAGEIAPPSPPADGEVAVPEVAQRV